VAGRAGRARSISAFWGPLRGGTSGAPLRRRFPIRERLRPGVVGSPCRLVAGSDMRISFSIERRYGISSVSQSEIAVPEAPARAVRPIRCTYDSGSLGKS